MFIGLVLGFHVTTEADIDAHPFTYHITPIATFGSETTHSFTYRISSIHPVSPQPTPSPTTCTPSPHPVSSQATPSPITSAPTSATPLQSTPSAQEPAPLPGVEEGTEESNTGCSSFGETCLRKYVQPTSCALFVYHFALEREPSISS